MSWKNKPTNFAIQILNEGDKVVKKIATEMLQQVIVGSPVDVLKTRIMNAKPGEYSSIADCVVKTFKEGPLAFYKGFQANAGRIVSWNIVMFVTLGQVRKQVYERYYKY